jgi:outer membrane usher protein
MSARPQTPPGAGHAAAAVLCLCVASLLLLVGPARAQEGPSEQQPQRALLSLSVNQVDHGEVLAIIRSGDILIEAATLAQAGIKDARGQREAIDGREFVSLASLSPGITYEFSERALTLALTAGGAHLGSVVVDLRSSRPAFDYVRATSAFLNYGFNWTGVGAATSAVEAGASLGPALALTTVSWDQRRGFVRGLSNVTFDERDRLRRWTMGDSLVAAGTLGSGLMIGGVHVHRDYGLDPYFVQYPMLGMTGTAVTPSTVEVKVNGRVVSRTTVAPGSFTLANIPMNSGSNDTQVVVRDAFGREQAMAAPFYLTTSALARGLHDFDYAVGFERAGDTTNSWEYGPLVAIGRHRYGFTDQLTAGFMAEASANTVTAGPTVNLRLPFGEFELAASASRSVGASGGAFSVGFARIGRRFTVNGRIRSMTSGYTMLMLDSSEDRPQVEAAAMLGVQVAPRVTLSLQEILARPHVAEPVSRTSVIAGIGLTRRLNAFVNASSVREPGRSRVELFAGVSLALAPYTNASVWGQRTPGGSGVMADIQKSLPLGIGYGYRAQAALGGNVLAEGVLSAQGRYGRYEAGAQVIDGQQSPYVNVTGGLVAIGGGVHPTRAVNESFALVRVPEVAGVRTFLNNQEMGRTNGHGDLLVSNLLPYYANRLGISDQDVPFDHEVQRVEQAVGPPYRGGAVVVFRAEQWQAVTGTVVLDRTGQTVLPSYGEVVVSLPDRAISSPVGSDGQFFLENVPGGRQSAVVVFRDVSCKFTLDVPASSAGVVNLGVVHCAVPEVK